MEKNLLLFHLNYTKKRFRKLWVCPNPIPGFPLPLICIICCTYYYTYSKCSTFPVWHAPSFPNSRFFFARSEEMLRMQTHENKSNKMGINSSSRLLCQLLGRFFSVYYCTGMKTPSKKYSKLQVFRHFYFRFPSIHNAPPPPQFPPNQPFIPNDSAGKALLRTTQEKKRFSGKVTSVYEDEDFLFPYNLCGRGILIILIPSTSPDLPRVTEFPPHPPFSLLSFCGQHPRYMRESSVRLPSHIHTKTRTF